MSIEFENTMATQSLLIHRNIINLRENNVGIAYIIYTANLI